LDGADGAQVAQLDIHEDHRIMIVNIMNWCHIGRSGKKGQVKRRRPYDDPSARAAYFV
jgi:hypothetical protein